VTATQIAVVFDPTVSLNHSMDMITLKPSHAIIAWTPASAKGTATAGQVRVGRWVPRTAPHWALPYTNLAGASSRGRRSLSDKEAIKALERDFKILRDDGLATNVIDAAFASIEGWNGRRLSPEGMLP
jgi:hypothetical protein